ncbi:MAG: hypothetical protein FJX23_00880 [Alphaproteobacteria bacterium]|nr:hypothetical protein [Alphaproteobacteria bacterium]
MMKLKLLQQKLVKTSVIVAGVVAALGAGAYGIYMWSDSLQQDFTKIEREARSMQSDVSMRENKAFEAEKYMGLYRQIDQSDESAKRSELDRDKAQKWISQVAAELRLTNLDGTFNPVVNVESEEFKRNTLVATTSKVTLTFGALSDEQLYRFVQAIAEDFPGYVRITKVTFERRGKIDDSTLINASKGTFPELVTGAVEFQWIAVKKAPSATTPQDGGMQ